MFQLWSLGALSIYLFVPLTYPHKFKVSPTSLCLFGQEQKAKMVNIFR